jgi:ABC-type glycerol-3-phosphate transport system substrate-binding protein
MFVAIVGIAIFAGFGGTNNIGTPSATIWGILPSQHITEVVRTLNLTSTKLNVTYVQKDPATYEAELINALAENRGPDIALLDDSMLYSQRNKIQPIPFSVFPERDYLNTFIDASNIFVDKYGILAVPVAIDPLVMYWNKNIFTAAGLANPPKTWVDFQANAPSIIKKTDSSTIIQSYTELGGYSNVTNAKEILATLLFQLGNPITQVNPDTDVVFPVIDQSSDKTAAKKPIESAVSFYTLFANPSNTAYSWNLSMPESRQAFLANKLAIYFGYASELPQIQDKNPNLNFDVAEVPQDANTIPATYGKVTGMAIMRTTKNYAGALAVISALVSKGPIDQWSELSELPPVRRDSISEGSQNPYMTIFERAAVKSKSWYDPNPKQSDVAFGDMVESITTGRKPPSGAISDLVGILNRLFGK